MSLLIALVAVPGARAQQPAAAAPAVIDGPSPDIVRPASVGISIARDGTGAVVYLKQVAGVAHVFASELVGGSFGAPVEVDSALGPSSSQPVVAAGGGGLLLIAFINGGQLYVSGRTSATAPLTAPVPMAGGAANPSISITNFGKAYLAFTIADGGGEDVRTAYYYNGSWAPESAPLNIVPADDAGTGSGRPEVAAAGDGVAIVVWGEAGHVFSRRVWGTTPSVVDEQADGPVAGCNEVSANEPVVGTEGDSSYADVAFHEQVSCPGGPGGSFQQSRVLLNRLHGSQYDGITQPDGLAGSASDGADDPQITMAEYGHGWVTSARTGSHDLFATALGDNGASIGTTQVNSLGNITAPEGVPATAGLYSNLIAWEQDPGSAGPPEIRVRYAPSGATLESDMVVSSAAMGPTDAASGLVAAGDVAGDSAVVWVQGPAGATEIVAAQLYQPPAPFGPSGVPPYARVPQPRLTWSPAREPWGPITYTVTIDGSQAGQTQATSLTAPAPLPDGRHTWQVTATNPAGQQSQSRTAAVFVDTVLPIIQLTLYGRGRPGSQLHIYAAYVDPPPAGQPAVDASGVAKILIRWGDGTVVPLRLGWHRSFHVYRRPGRYTITALVTDKAGNTGRALVKVAIVQPKKKHKPRPKGRRG